MQRTTPFFLTEELLQRKMELMMEFSLEYSEDARWSIYFFTCTNPPRRVAHPSPDFSGADLDLTWASRSLISIDHQAYGCSDT
jgi:hypothetical protein